MHHFILGAILFCEGTRWPVHWTWVHISFFFLVLFLHNRVWSLQARRSTAGIWSRASFLHRRTEGTKLWMKISFPSKLVQGHGSYWFVCLNASTRNSPYIFNTEDLAPWMWVLTWLFAPQKMGQALLGLWCDSNGWAAMRPDHQGWLTNISSDAGKQMAGLDWVLRSGQWASRDTSDWHSRGSLTCLPWCPCPPWLHGLAFYPSKRSLRIFHLL